MEELISEFAKECTEKGLKTAKKVRKHIFDTIWANYKGKAPKWRVELAADDITESVCLNLGIPHDC